MAKTKKQFEALAKGDKDPSLKLATVEITLKADSGYKSSMKARISANQWSEIVKIVNQK